MSAPLGLLGRRQPFEFLHLFTCRQEFPPDAPVPSNNSKNSFLCLRLRRSKIITVIASSEADTELVEVFSKSVAISFRLLHPLGSQ